MNQPVAESKWEATPYVILGVNLVVLALSIAWVCGRWRGDRADVDAGASVERPRAADGAVPSRPAGGG